MKKLCFVYHITCGGKNKFPALYLKMKEKLFSIICAVHIMFIFIYACCIWRDLVTKSELGRIVKTLKDLLQIYFYNFPEN